MAQDDLNTGRQKSSEVFLSDSQRRRIQTRHKHSIEYFGYQPQALFWSSREIQQIRFQKLAEILPATHAPGPLALLDVGCGFGDLKVYLQKQGFDIDYRGIDLSEDMVYSARCQQPGIRVESGDLFDLNPDENAFDYLFLSGALNEVVESEEQRKGAYARAVIQRMYQTARRGVAFNLLDARNAWVRSRPDLQSFYPHEVVEFCQIFADRVSWQDGYVDNDFSVFLYKSATDAETKP